MTHGVTEVSASQRESEVYLKKKKNENSKALCSWRWGINTQLCRNSLDKQEKISYVISSICNTCLSSGKVAANLEKCFAESLEGQHANLGLHQHLLENYQMRNFCVITELYCSVNKWK